MQKSRGNLIMEEKKVLKGQELEKVNGGVDSANAVGYRINTDDSIIHGGTVAQKGKPDAEK